MLTAVNAIKLILLISLGLFYFIGLGWLVIGPLLHGNLFTRIKEFQRSQEISLMMISGLIINYGITIILHSLISSLILGGILAIIGFSCYLGMSYKSLRKTSLSLYSFYKWLGIILVASLFLGPIITIPLSDWDALSIWFLHAKMIYTAGSFSLLTGWQHPSVLFSHVDYPNLIPTLAAQITYLMGYWNEYLPKLSLFFLLLPAIILIFSFFKRSFGFLFLIILIPFSFASRLWDGYMDGYLSLFFAISMLLLGKYHKESKPIDLISSLFCLLPLLYLKNEGVLAVISGFFAILFTLLLKRTSFSFRRFFKNHWKLFLFIFILVIPFLIWTYYKHQWGITSDLELGTNQSFIRFMNRIQNGSYKLVLDNTNFELKNGLILLGILLSASIAVKQWLPKELIPAIIAAGIYSLGIIVVYMVTPYDLNWHLHQSVYRTLLTVNTSIYVACFYLVSFLEENEESFKDKFKAKAY